MGHKFEGMVTTVRESGAMHIVSLGWSGPTNSAPVSSNNHDSLVGLISTIRLDLILIVFPSPLQSSADHYNHEYIH